MTIIILDYRIWNLFICYISMPVMITVSYINDSFFYSFIQQGVSWCLLCPKTTLYASNKENWEFLLWEQVKHSMQDLLHHVITVFIDVNFSPHFNFISSNLFMFKLHKYKLSALSKAGQFIYNYSQNSNILF